jgi:hemerythrin-like metal-binding protein
MQKPKWLYEALPWIYVLAGVTVMLQLRGGLSLFSGGILVGTGLLVRQMRKRFRRETLQHVVLGQLNLPAPLTWRKTLAVGQDLLDRQHQQLFALSNELIRAVARRKPDAAVQALIKEVQAEMRSHVNAELRLTAEAGCPLPDTHRHQHALLLSRLEQQRERCARGQIDTDELVRFIALDVVAAHVAGEADELARVFAAQVPERETTLG